MKSSLLDATCRVAFAGLIHDLGKFAQRARIDASEASIKLHQQMYCPRRQAGDRIWWTHQHAAYTALAFPVIEKVAPALIGEKVTGICGVHDSWRLRTRTAKNGLHDTAE